VRILYLNHTGNVSGAERSLLELLPALPADVSRRVATPPGPFAAAAREQGEAVVTVPAAEGSLRLHPIHTPAALGGFARSALAVGRLARRERADLVHANSVRAGLVAALARRLGAPPAVVYVHDCLPDTRVANMTRRRILSGSGVVLANSDYTAASFAGRDGSAAVRTSYNGMVDERGELVSLRGAEAPRRAEARRRLGLEQSGPLIGLVAQITPWKGQDTAIEALAALRREYPDARLLLVGEAKFAARGTRFDNPAYLTRLRRLVADLGLDDGVAFLGERRDALEIMAALDVCVAPSWEEPFGRAIVEAMALGTPVVATEVGGPAEIVEDGVSGRLVPPRSPELLAVAVRELLASPELRERMAAEGRRRVGRFSLAAHAESVVRAYRDLLGTRG
jgi:glycosyltransferase involved in cell wall biosynthesis